jgi:hypothetical protein
MRNVDHRHRLCAQLRPEKIALLNQRELMSVVATIWSDVELAAVLHGSEQFFWERLHHYAERGYLTAKEDQGTRRLLAFGYARQLVALLKGEAPDEPVESVQPEQHCDPY